MNTENREKEMVEETQKTGEVTDWETKAKEWLSSLPKDHKLSSDEVYTWLNSNLSSLPQHLQSLSQSQLLQHFTHLHSSLPSPSSKEVKRVILGENPARFQRTDLWRPVYSWLESLDMDEAINNKDIEDWVAVNPEIYDQLLSKHSRHHLMHYMKRLHIKILNKKKGMHYNAIKGTPTALPASLSSNPLTKVPKDSDLYQAKRREALLKYEILLELEKQLSAIIPSLTAANNLEES